VEGAEKGRAERRGWWRHGHGRAERGRTERRPLGRELGPGDGASAGFYRVSPADPGRRTTTDSARHERVVAVRARGRFRVSADPGESVDIC
jgi:hypothetical protein